MTTIVQIVPEIGPGTGVGSVAHHLEQEWLRTGVTVERLTLAESGGAWLPTPRGGIQGKLAVLARVVWFSTAGTRRARRHLADHPDTLSVCHNDALAGDVYVNHGLVQASMRSRGVYWYRILRNPLHLFTTVRDRRRYRSDVHRLVVNLSDQDERLLRELHPSLRPRTAVVTNGVDTTEFAPPSAAEREAARTALDLTEADVLAVFIGHEYARKGLDLVVDALDHCPDRVRLLVVGGSPDLVAAMQSRDAAVRHRSRITFVGPSRDPRPFLRAADVLCLPSAYEASPLVVLEALAMGVPVIGTRTGSIPDVVEDGVNGYLVDRSVTSVAEALTTVDGADRPALRRAARLTAEQHTWAHVAARYLELLQGLRAEPGRGREVS
ncbi:hypothetical protein ASH01_15850 [Terrabacter sp. Soil811]|uniref:glycosyltransferase family 4 protein n=1 Tax=Terrabacter sp. Soil811 TaxID=1736419 RepID=UPI0006F9350C|nr:glycosyltransferase family 4 protein [Terrabacter sp. Soil811]KRF43271.1 hypothetical protein ASH01_15850 [Terrabacter sp. Soil811]